MAKTREIEVAEELLNRAKAKESLYEFLKQAWHVVEGKRPFIESWHAKVICEHLEAVTRGELRNLLINIPPRMSKSTIISVMWPAWVWLHYPEKRFLFASYSHNLAIRDSINTRMVIKSDYYQKRWGNLYSVIDNQDTIRKFTNNKGGVRLTTSPDGSATGEGADLLVCLPYESQLVTNHGTIPIGKIVEEKLDVQILSFNHIEQKTEYKDIEIYEKNIGKKILQIEVDGEMLECTEDHPVFVEGKGYIPAKEIEIGDILLCL